MELRSIQISEERATQGIWVDYRDARLLIGSINGSAYKNLRQRKLQAALTAARGKKLTTEQIEKLNVENMAETILLGWENLTEGGQNVPYSKEKALDLLTRIPILVEDVASYAESIAMFSMLSAEEASQKLGEGSAGNLITVATKTT
jgi:hypothetical protein